MAVMRMHRIQPVPKNVQVLKMRLAYFSKKFIGKVTPSIKGEACGNETPLELPWQRLQ